MHVAVAKGQVGAVTKLLNLGAEPKHQLTFSDKSERCRLLPGLAAGTYKTNYAKATLALLYYHVSQLCSSIAPPTIIS